MTASTQSTYTPRAVRETSGLGTLDAYLALTKTKAPKKIGEAAAALRRLVIHEGPRTNAALRAAEDALAAYPKALAYEAVEAVLSAVEAGEEVTMPEDRSDALAVDLAEADRAATTVTRATKAAERILVSEVQRAGVSGLKLDRVYAEVVAWTPTDSIAANRQHDYFAAEVLGLVERLVQMIAGESMTQQERKVLSGLFKDQPPTLPTVETARKEIAGLIDSTPRAKAEAARLETKEGQRVENQISAQLAARARTASPENSPTK